MDNDCIFCKIIKGEIPSYKIWEDEKHLAFLDIFPQSPGMAVIVTKEHHPSYLIENDQETLNNLVSAMKRVGELLDTKLGNILRVTFLIEGLDVSHLHAKLIPVYKGVFSEHPQPEREEDSKLKALAEKITS